jgi:CheY-like chemotaxis protein
MAAETNLQLERLSADFFAALSGTPGKSLMNEWQKILVVDNGERAPDDALSAELAGLGYASVTAPFDAADDVLAMLPSIAAVVLQMPREAGWSERKQFLELAERLRTNLRASKVPVIVMSAAASGGSYASLLQSQLKMQVASRPER